MYVNAKAELVTLAPGLRPERRFAPLARGLITCGIPQGSILRPLLFLIYINDLPNSLEYSSTRMFADDTTLPASGKSVPEVEIAINYDLANAKRWLSANKLSLNLIKTEYLLIGMDLSWISA